MMLTAEREYREAIADPDCEVDGPSRELWPSRTLGWLSKVQLTRVNALLAEVNAVMSAGEARPDTQLYAVQFALAPASPARKQKRKTSP